MYLFSTSDDKRISIKIGKSNIHAMQAPLNHASPSALARRTSVPIGAYGDADEDEDSLLRSKWSIELFPELVADRSQHDLHLLGRWLQVCPCSSAPLLPGACSRSAHPSFWHHEGRGRLYLLQRE